MSELSLPTFDRFIEMLEMLEGNFNPEQRARLGALVQKWADKGSEKGVNPEGGSLRTQNSTASDSLDTA